MTAYKTLSIFLFSLLSSTPVFANLKTLPQKSSCSSRGTLEFLLSPLGVNGQRYWAPAVVAIKGGDGRIARDDFSTEVSLTFYQYSGQATATLTGKTKVKVAGGIAYFPELRTEELNLNYLVISAASNDPCVQGALSDTFNGIEY